MSHTYASCLIHFVFGTKERLPLITSTVRNRLWSYMAGIGQRHRMPVLTVGGIENHVHLLASLPPTMPVAKAVQIFKGASSKWLNEMFPFESAFAWQEGYGAFSIGRSQVAATIEYVECQEDHHRSNGFEDEFRSFLTKHEIAYDDQHVWG